MLTDGWFKHHNTNVHYEMKTVYKYTVEAWCCDSVLLVHCCFSWHITTTDCPSMDQHEIVSRSVYTVDPHEREQGPTLLVVNNLDQYFIWSVWSRLGFVVLL